MISIAHLLTFAATAFVIIVVPGPSVMFAVGRALALGRGSALITVLGNAAGTLIPLLAVAFGLGAVIAASATALIAIKLAGAAYLIYLGVQAIRHRNEMADALGARVAPITRARVFRQGFLVGMTNPKVLVFYAAVLPQFVDPRGGPVPLQMLLLGAIFLTIAVLSDGTWALLAGTARSWFARSPRRLAAVGGTGGVMIIGVGATVALSGNSQ